MTFITTPSGSIVMWHGLLANIPAGWLLCDGANSTPDLRDKFVRGAAAAANPGGTGGADAHTHDIASSGAHPHTTGAPSSTTAALEEIDIAAGPNHTHDIASSGAHTHTSDAGSTLPAYYAIAYIMKT